MKKTNQNSVLVDLGLLMMRIMIGVVFLFHGSQKLFGAFEGSGMDGFAAFLGQMEVPYPTLSAYLAGLAEFVGGLMVLTGVGLRLAVVPMIFTMLVASFMVHGDSFSLQKGGMEYSLTLAVILAGMGLTGAGRFSACALFSHKAERAAESFEQTNLSRVET